MNFAYALACSLPKSKYASAKMVKRPTALVLGLISITSLLGCWWWVSAVGWLDPLFLPSPHSILQRLWMILQQGYMGVGLLTHIGMSLWRITQALLLVLITAIPLGIAMGRWPLLKGLVDPIIEFFRPIPPLAYLPLIVIWAGIGEGAKVLLIFIAIFAPVLIATANAVKAVSPSRLRAAASLGASSWQQTRWIVLPSTLPEILVGIRIGLGVGWSTLVAAELIAATEGLGFMVQSASQFLVTEVVILGIVLIGLIAISLELVLRWLQQRWVPWYGKNY